LPCRGAEEETLMMTLEGSCRCGAVQFRVKSHAPQPYQLCYCSICRKTAGGGGFAINLSAVTETLEVEGREAIGVYRAEIDQGGHCETSTGERNFCTRCATALWLYDPTWPELLHPFASAIDTDLPVPPSRTHLMLRFKASWVEPDIRPGDLAFDDYPEQSIEDWHREKGLWLD
jgi:hypothetical protein